MLSKKINKEKPMLLSKDSNNRKPQQQPIIENEQNNSINMINHLLELYNDLEIQQQDDNEIFSMKIDELEELVDVKIKEYTEKIVESCIRYQLRQEINEKFPQIQTLFETKNIQLLNDNDNNCNPSNHTQTYLNLINTIITPHLEHINSLTQQNHELKAICQNQHLFIKKIEKQMDTFKHKYIELATQFNQFKFKSREIENKYFMEINEQERLIWEFRDQMRVLEEKLEEKDESIKRIQKESDQKIQSLIANFQAYHEIDFTLFTYELTQLISDEILWINHQNVATSTQSIQTQIISTFTNILQENSALKNQVQSLKTTLQSTNSLIQEMNQLDVYQMKILTKDLTKNHQLQYEQCNQNIQIDIETYLLSTIKNQFMERMKENKHLRDQCKVFEEEIIHSQEKINQLMKFISSKCINQEQKEQPMQVKIQDSPIQLIQQNGQDTRFQSKQAQQQVKEFDINQKDEEISQKTYIAKEKSQKSFNLIEEILVLRQENQKLIKEIETLKNQKTQKLFQNISEFNTKRQNTQNDQQKTIGKIKRFSIDTTGTSNNCKKQNETKQYNQDDKVFTQKEQLQQRSHSSQIVKNLQKKVNQYKQSIVNLNEIINYMINQLRGYSCGSLFNQACRSHNNIPVRKFSHLDNQINTQYSENLTNQTSINSFSSTLKGSSISKTQKVAGKIAILNEKRNSQALTQISVQNFKENRILQKPLVVTQNETKLKSQLLAKQVLKQKYENFQFIRKLSIKEKKCKQLLNKFHIYLDFYVDQISNLQKNIDQQQNFKDQNQTNNWQEFSEYGSSYPYLKTNYSKKFRDNSIDIENESWDNLSRHNQKSSCRRKVGTLNVR